MRICNVRPLVGVVLLLLFQAAALAQTAPNRREPASAPASVTVTDSEVRVLQAWLDDAQKHQDQMLTTVWGALGTIATLAALLVGFGWFANLRMYDRDKSALEESLRATLLDEQRRVREDLTSTLNGSLLTLRTELDASIATLRTDLMKELEAASKRASTQLDSQARGLKSDITALKQETLNLQLQDALQQREEALRSRVKRNVLQASVTALQIAKQIDDASYSLGEALDLVSTDIDSILEDASCRVDNFLMAQVVEELGSIKGSHSAAAAALRVKATTMKMG